MPRAHGRVAYLFLLASSFSKCFIVHSTVQAWSESMEPCVPGGPSRRVWIITIIGSIVLIFLLVAVSFWLENARPLMGRAFLFHRHALSEIPRPIHVMSPGHTSIIGEEVEWYGRDYRLQDRMNSGYMNNVIGQVR